MSERVVKIYCNRDTILIHLLTNKLENEQIEYQVIGELSTNVLGIDNPTQEACILVHQNDAIRARKIIEDNLGDE